MTIAERITKHLEDNEQSVVDFGQQMKPPVSGPSVWRWKTGADVPRKKRLASLARVLKVNIKMLQGETK